MGPWIPLGGRHRAFLLVVCLFLTGAVFVSAQSTAVEIETLLASPAVTYGQASRFVLQAADVATFSDPAEAFRFAADRNWLPRNADSEGQARLDGIALLLMQSFGLRGGIMFTLTGSPHFAYREMEYMGFIRGRISPGQRVSGDTLMYLTGRVLAHVGE